MSVENLVSTGPLILAIPVAAAAGAVTFLSPCCLPLVPGYLSYITGMSGAGADKKSAAAARKAAASAGAGTAETTGAAGTTGTTGTAGTAGTARAAGTAGTAGTAGAAGAAGTAGTAGADVTAGTAGADVTAGADAVSAGVTAGTAGTVGTAGADATTGADAVSAGVTAAGTSAATTGAAVGAARTTAVADAGSAAHGVRPGSADAGSRRTDGRGTVGRGTDGRGTDGRGTDGRGTDGRGTGAGGAVATATVAAPRTPGAAPTGRAVAGTALFVAGFSAVFAVYGLAFGGLGHLLRAHDTGLTQVLGGVTIVLGLMFAGAFDRFSFAGRIFRPSARPRAGLAGAPLLGVMFGFGWTPCIGPTLTAVLALSETSGTAARGAFLAFVYGLGLGIPFLIVAGAFQRAVNVLGFFRRNARLVSRIGGAMLVLVGVLEVTGAWTSAIAWLHTHWFSGYSSPL